MDAIIWKDVPGREGEYKVSTDGQVYSVPREITMKNGRTRRIGGGILAQVKAGYGYWTVQLGAGKREYVHRLVAKTFLGDMGSRYEVNHKDENPNNNHLSNLEWLTKKENLAYGTRLKRSGACSVRRTAKAVEAVQDGRVVATYQSFHEAAKAGFSRYHISQCCKGKEKLYKGLKWQYRETSDKEKTAPGVTSTESGEAE